MPEQQTNSLPIGTVVHERYRITAIVGRGGLGTVYQVMDILFGKQNVYALKELIDQSPGARKQFELESQWLQSLDHNHIPKVREHFEWRQRLYLVMDFVDGENLEQKLARQGGRPFTEEQTLRWIMPICAALQYLHTRTPPILHRDIKPANIIVTPAGHVVLVDLGIAKAHLPGANQTATFVRKAGTEGYAPPEQYTANGQTGPWSDVYGLGATLYQLLTGQVPPTAVERVALDSSLGPHLLKAAVSPWISNAVLRALALRPAERFQSVQALAEALAGPTGKIATMLPGTTPLPRSPSLPPFTQNPPNSLPPLAPSTPPFGSSVPGARSPMRTPTPPALGADSWPDLTGGAAIMSSPPRATNIAGITPASRLTPPAPPSTPGAQLPVKSTQQLNSQKLSESGRKTLLQLQEEVNAAERGATKTTIEEPARPRVWWRSPWAMGGAACTLLVIVAVVVALIFNASAPPDRSSPRATVLGYFAALQAQDYARAWQYSSATVTNVTSKSSFISGLQADDAQFGRVTSVLHLDISNDSTNSATAQVNVMRGTNGAKVPMSYTLTLSLYNGSAWLIDSIITS